MVGIVIVSHSYKVAEGIYDLAMQMAAENDHIIPAGGMEDGSIGTDAIRIADAIRQANQGDGVVVFADLGSAIMSSETAMEMLEEENINVRICPDRGRAGTRRRDQRGSHLHFRCFS